MWIITAWQCILLEEIVKGFNKCCVSSEMDGTDDDMLQIGSEEVGDIRSKCEEDKGTNNKDGESDTDR